MRGVVCVGGKGGSHKGHGADRGNGGTEETASKDHVIPPGCLAKTVSMRSMVLLRLEYPVTPLTAGRTTASLPKFLGHSPSHAGPLGHAPPVIKTPRKTREIDLVGLKPLGQGE